MSLCINPQCPQSKNSDQILFCQSCGSELLLAGRYRVDKLMSNKGGFGDTYEVTEMGVPKVLKILKSTNAKALELFEREYRVLGNLTDAQISGIPKVENLFLYQPRDSTQALHCLVMERILGMDLEEYIQAMKRPIDEKTARGWLEQLTQILQEIHSRGIVHRDIKPSNIILQPTGQLTLIDFGAVKEAAVNLSSQTQIYTPGYAAPEQQQPGGASPQSDFYALGRTLVYLLTGKSPVELHDINQDQLIWRNQTSNVSPAFLDLVDRLMDRDPQQRPNSTATIFKEIAAIPARTTQQNTGNTTLPAVNLNSPSAPSPSGKKSSFATDLAKGLLPAILVLGGLAAWWLWPKTPKSGESASITGESFAEIKGVPAGIFKFGGSTTWATTRQLQSSVDAAIKGVFPKYDLVYTDPSSAMIPSAQDGKCDKKPGSNAGICWLIAGDLDFVQSSIALEKSKYADRITAANLQQEAVAYDALSVVVNLQLKIPGLTLEQLRDIYTGKATNWSQVGGPDLPIVPFSRTESSGGTVSSFKDLVLQKEDVLKFQSVGSLTEGLQRVKNTPGGIYFGAAKEVIVDYCYTQPVAIGKTPGQFVKPYQEPLQSPLACSQGQRNKINTAVVKSQEYPLTRKIYVIIKADGTERQKAGEAYAKLLKTKQGQALLEKAGFVSIYE